MLKAFHVRRLSGRPARRATIAATLPLAAFAAVFAIAADVPTGSCGIDAITDRIWDQPSCPSGVCRTLLLRSDGTYQVGVIALGPRTVYCESGQWQQEAGSCGTIRLKPCGGPERTRSWTIHAATLVFGESSYGVGSDQQESTAFTGCTVRRQCDGLSCSEYLACLQECSGDIFPDPTCPSRCLDRVSPSQQQTASLLSCAQRSGCADDACLQRACTAEFRACAAN
jgi:hypothetical protein